MRRSQRKPSVRKKATRRQAPRTARRRARARGGGPQSGGMIPLAAMAPLAAFFTSVPGIILIVVGLFLMLFITANKGALPGLKGQLPLDLVPKVVAGLFGERQGSPGSSMYRNPISINPFKYLIPDSSASTRKGLLGSGVGGEGGEELTINWKISEFDTFNVLKADAYRKLPWLVFGAIKVLCNGVSSAGGHDLGDIDCSVGRGGGLNSMVDKFAQYNILDAIYWKISANAKAATEAAATAAEHALAVEKADTWVPGPAPDWFKGGNITLTGFRDSSNRGENKGRVVFTNFKFSSEAGVKLSHDVPCNLGIIWDQQLSSIILNGINLEKVLGGEEPLPVDRIFDGQDAALRRAISVFWNVVRSQLFPSGRGVSAIRDPIVRGGVLAECTHLREIVEVIYDKLKAVIGVE